MIAESSNSKLFKDYRIPTDDGNYLHAKALYPKPPVQPRRIVFISPLVGAGAAQSLIISRSFTRRGAILLSFEYRGHTRSSGIFDLEKTIVDVRHALAWTEVFAHGMGLPLHGFATCYGAVPLFAQFNGRGNGCLMRSLSVVSGLFRLNQILSIEDFAKVYSRHSRRDLGAREFLDAVVRNEIDWNGDTFRNALYDYLKGLFPELRIGLDYFEELRYERADIHRALLQLSDAHFLGGIHVPPGMPCNVFMGIDDEVMGLKTAAGRQAYARRVQSLVPHAVIHEHEIDHFGRGADHDAVTARLAEIFERYDASPVAPPHGSFARRRSVPQ
ncbi:MAG: hypothetical protein IT426_03425 [Pirellulales bacterium]|nr:hypothetical protein [Pirellulales bacterium]